MPWSDTDSEENDAPRPGLLLDGNPEANDRLRRTHALVCYRERLDRVARTHLYFQEQYNRAARREEEQRLNPDVEPANQGDEQRTIAAIDPDVEPANQGDVQRLIDADPPVAAIDRDVEPANQGDGQRLIADPTIAAIDPDVEPANQENEQDTVQRLIQSLRCILCGRKPITRSMHTICGHTHFCESCIRSEIMERGRCPRCNRRLNQQDLYPLYL